VKIQSTPMWWMNERVVEFFRVVYDLIEAIQGHPKEFQLEILLILSHSFPSREQKGATLSGRRRSLRRLDSGPGLCPRLTRLTLGP
jgi:hypothetical protein